MALHAGGGGTPDLHHVAISSRPTAERAGWPVTWGRYFFRMDRRDYPTRKLRLGDADGDGGVSVLSAGERVMLVWQLTLQARAFMEDLRDEPRLRRDVGRVVRRGR